MYRHGYAADRALKSQKVSQMVQVQRRKEIRANTYDQLRNFEEHARAFQKRNEEPIDNLPLNATASTMRKLSDQALPDGASDSSDSPRTPHALRMKKSSSDSFFGVPSRLDFSELDYADDRLHARRPPSPLAYYDYGNLNLKPRSAFSQQRSDSNSAQTPRQEYLWLLFSRARL